MQEKWIADALQEETLKIKNNGELILTADLNGNGAKRSRLNSRKVQRKPQQREW